MDDTPRFGIGEFSALTRISVRMLRHYDEHRVLVPAAVDPDTGYRRYAAAQVATAARIRALRDVGFGVSSIAALLAVRDPAELTHALQIQRAALLADVRTAQQRLHLIDALLDKESVMTDITITERTEAALTLATLRGTIPTYSDEHLLWERFMPAFHGQGLQPAGPCGCLEYDDEFQESDPDVAVFFPVAAGTDVAAPLTVVTLPARRVAVARLVGPYSDITEANQRLGAHLAEQGLRMADHGYNLYLTDPSSTPAEQNITEICYPVAKA